MRNRSVLLAAAVSAALAASHAHAVVFTDSFDYPAGTLAEVTVVPAGNAYTGRTNPFGPTWYVAGASTTDTITVTAPTLTGPAWLGGSGNSAEWAGPSGGNSARIEIGPFSGPNLVGGLQQTLYYSLALNVTDVAVLNPNTAVLGNILAGFNTVSGPQAAVPSVIGTRLVARQHPNDATKYQLGMSKNSSAGVDVTWDPAVLDANTTQFVVGAYELIGTGNDANDVSQLWINPDSATTFGALAAPTPNITATSGGDITTNRIESFMFRQSGPAASGPTNTGIRIDEIRIDTTWAGVAPGAPNDWMGGDGAWSDGTKWSTAAAPNAAGKFVRFAAAAAPATVTVNANHTAGTMHFNSPNGYTLAAGGGTVTLDGGSSVVVFDGNHTVAAPVVTTGDLNITVATGDGITLSNLTTPATARVLKSGYGDATVNNVRAKLLGVNGGTLRIAPNSTASGVSVVDTLDIPALTNVARPAGFTFDVGPRGSLDITDNKLIIRTGAVGTATAGVYNGHQGLVQRAYHGGAWDRSGLTTSMPQAKEGLTTIAVATGAQLGISTFGGQSVAPTDTIAFYTYGGDTNFDGMVSGDDYGTIDFSILVPGAEGYYNGDFNYDGVINGDDYGVIDFTIIAQGAPFPTSGAATSSSVTAVPEPAACGFAFVAASVSLLTRRRRNA